MADSQLIDIFDLCVERLAAGETVEDCLRDYPDHADELRGLLETGFLVFQAQAETTDIQQAQAHTRTRIEDALQTNFVPHKGQKSMSDPEATPDKQKNSSRPLRRTIFWMGSAAAAIFALAFGFAFATTPTPAAQPQSVAELATNEHAFRLTATQYVLEITQTAQAITEADATATPSPTSTTTAIPTMTAPNADTVVMGEVASTSVAGYLAMTATMLPAAPLTVGKDTTLTNSVEPAEPVEAAARDADKTDATSTDGRIVSESGAAAVTGGGGGIADIMPPPAIAVPSTSSSESRGLAAPLNLQQEQLQPLKAGEIDDNAEWDTYTEFRRNYLSTYGAMSIIDFDITGRQIIMVVDAAGQPILGARVEVYMDKTLVSKSITYATGLTLFFPNADASTQRRDEFKVVVTVGQYQAFQTLDLSKISGGFKVQMPIVIERDTQQVGLPTVPPSFIETNASTTPTSIFTPAPPLR